MSDFAEMNKENKNNLVDSSQAKTDGNPSKKSSLVIVFYWIINLFYFSLFLQSCFLVLMSPMIFDGGDSVKARIGFYIIISIPIIIISIVISAGYFYRKGRIKSTFLVLLLPPLFYLVFMLIDALFPSLGLLGLL